MNIPSKENFALSKVKIGKGGGLDVHFETQEAIGSEIYTEKHHLESAKDVHPDFENIFKSLRTIVARIYKLTSFLSVVDTPDFKATAKQKKEAEAFADELLADIEVRGISLSGKDDNVGVIVTSVLTVINGQKVAINTPRIKFSNVNYGFEEELESAIGAIEEEAYLFLFKGKKAQLELFDPVFDGKAAASGENNKDDDKPFPDVDDPAEENDDEDY